MVAVVVGLAVRLCPSLTCIKCPGSSLASKVHLLRLELCVKDFRTPVYCVRDLSTDRGGPLSPGLTRHIGKTLVF